MKLLIYHYAISKNCSQLKDFFLSNNKLVTDNGVLSMVKNCKFLHLFYLSGCAELTDMTMFHINTHCTALRFLSMSDIPKITDLFVAQIFLSNKNLECLDVANTSATDISCLRVSHNSDKISVNGQDLAGTKYSLNVDNRKGMRCTALYTHCIAFKSQSFATLFQLSLNLVDLSLNTCSTLDDSALALLPTVCPNLKQIALIDCQLLTVFTVQNVIEQQTVTKNAQNLWLQHYYRYSGTSSATTLSTIRVV